MTKTEHSGAKIGYARVSTWDQNLDLQVAALTEAGCTRIFMEKASGTKTDRPELAKALDYVRPGDTLVAWRLDRVGRSLKHLIDTVTGLDEREVGFQSLKENIDTTTATGRLIFHIFAALAEFERALIVDRTKAGLEAARARGSKSGRKPVLSPKQIATAKALHSGDPAKSVTEIAEILGGVSRATVYRALASVADMEVTA